MIRPLFTAAAGVSLLLGMAAAGVWARSYWVCESFARIGPDGVYELSASRGLVLLHRGRYDRPNPAERARWEYAPMGAYDLDALLCGPTAAGNPTRFHWVGSYDANDGIRYRELTVPCWALATPALPLPLLWLRHRARRWLRARRGHCLACGYDLAGNVSHVCPECGTAVVKRNA